MRKTRSNCVLFLRLARPAALIVVGAALAGRSHAALFNFTYDDGVDKAFGQLSTDAGNVAIGGYLTVTEGLDVGTYALYGNPNAPSASYSPTGAFLYDNVLLPSSTPSLNTNGLLFTGGGREVNIWGNGGEHDYSFYSFENGGYSVAQDRSGTFTLTPAPEPVSAGVLSTGVLGLLSRRRRR